MADPDRANASLGGAERGRTRPGALLLTICLVALHAAPVRAQDDLLLGATGAGAGLVMGLYTTTAVYVAKARAGRYLFSVDEVVAFRLENLPMLAGPVAGTLVGLHSGHSLGEGALWGTVGFGAGALLGAGLGELAWDTDEGRWAGAIVGSAVGMIAGFWIGARRGWDVDESGPDQPPAALSFHVPVSLGR